MSKITDVFISYRRKTTEPNAQAIEKALEGGDFRHPLGQSEIVTFRDGHDLRAGTDWRKALRENAGVCKVILVLIDKHWLGRFASDAFPKWEQADGKNETDWVAAELQYALDREVPASLLVVQASDDISLSGAGNVFRSRPRVQQAFEQMAHQHLVWNNRRGDTAELRRAVISAMSDYDKRLEKAQAVVSSPVSSPTFAVHEKQHWLKFIGRKNQWHNVESALGLRGPLRPRFHSSRQGNQSVAFCWCVESDEDEPAHFSSALAHYLGSEGRLRSTAQDFTEETTCPLGSASIASIFSSIADYCGSGWELIDANPGGLNARLQDEFVPELCNAVATSQIGSCIRFEVSIQQKSASEAHQFITSATDFCALWNSLNWTALQRKVAVVFFLVGEPKKNLLHRFKRPKTATDIGPLTPDCYAQWRQQFVDARLAMREWSAVLAETTWNKNYRYRDVKNQIMQQGS